MQQKYASWFAWCARDFFTHKFHLASRWHRETVERNVINWRGRELLVDFECHSHAETLKSRESVKDALSFLNSSALFRHGRDSHSECGWNAVQAEWRWWWWGKEEKTLDSLEFPVVLVVYSLSTPSTHPSIDRARLHALRFHRRLYLSRPFFSSPTFTRSYFPSFFA